MISEFTVKVQLGVTPELAAILGAMLQVTTATAAVPSGAQQQGEAKEPQRVEVTAEQPEEGAEGAPARRRRAAKSKEATLTPPPAADEATPGVDEAEGKPGSTDAPGQLAGAEANTDDNANTGTDGNTSDESASDSADNDKSGNDDRQYTEEDIREAMHKTRQRIEGEDYKTNTDGDAYKRYHRQLTGAFKNIAATLGAEKPSALAPDKRGDFIRQCEELAVSASGNLEVPLPF